MKAALKRIPNRSSPHPEVASATTRYAGSGVRESVVLVGRGPDGEVPAAMRGIDFTQYHYDNVRGHVLVGSTPHVPHCVAVEVNRPPRKEVA